MKLVAVLAIVLIVFSLGCVSSGRHDGGVTMKVESSDLGEFVPKQFTCDGEGISPSLSWSGFPNETKSFAIAVKDPDAPMGTWIHWLVYNIPKNKTHIAQNEIPGTEVINDFKKEHYGGPCPPSGTHRYYFIVYALDVADLGKISDKNEFFEKVESHTIAKGELMSKYSRE